MAVVDTASWSVGRCIAAVFCPCMRREEDATLAVDCTCTWWLLASMQYIQPAKDDFKLH
jgi:hypothetical protein